MSSIDVTNDKFDILSEDSDLNDDIPKLVEMSLQCSDDDIESDAVLDKDMDEPIISKFKSYKVKVGQKINSSMSSTSSGDDMDETTMSGLKSCKATTKQKVKFPKLSSKYPEKLSKYYGDTNDTKINTKEKIIFPVLADDNDQINTDGISYTIFTKLLQDGVKIDPTKQCQFCSKIFPEFITVSCEDNPVCWHCLFFMNEEIVIRKMYSIDISSYKSFCSSGHVIENCQRPDSCILCLNKTICGVEQSDANPDINQFIDTLNDGMVFESDDELELMINI
jgi:hypothetical protein